MNTVTLKGGVSVLADVLKLCWRLEAQGVRFSLDADGRLEVGPKDLLTPADFRAVWQSRHEVARIASYRPPPGGVTVKAPIDCAPGTEDGAAGMDTSGLSPRPARVEAASAPVDTLEAHPAAPASEDCGIVAGPDRAFTSTEPLRVPRDRELDLLDRFSRARRPCGGIADQ